jgi:putative transposase
MTTYTQILYQVVFSTKRRERTLIRAHRDDLYKYIWGLLENKKCHPYIINGVEDHIHILTHIHPSVSLAALVKDIKLASSVHIKASNLFPEFDGWQEGYGAFTYSQKQKETLINYIFNQEVHHQKHDFLEEYRKLLEEERIEIDERYFL